MFNRDEDIISQVSYLRTIVNTKVDSIIKEAEETQQTLNNANNIIKDLESKLKEVESKYTKLLHDYNKSLEAYELIKTSTTTTAAAVTPSTVIPFDSAIHSHKPMRPITKLVRNQILTAYETVYKKDEDCKTLTDFYKWIQDNIHASISRSEIEGVLYNRFDERLYQ